MWQLPEWKLRERLQFSALTTYALYAERAPGDQPGQRSGRYLTKWRTLPEGVHIAKEKFELLAPNAWYAKADLWRPFEYAGQTNQSGVPGLPFPAVAPEVGPVQVPHIAFDHNGSLVQYDQGNPAKNRVYLDEYIWLTRGSIFKGYDGAGNMIPFSVRETPPGNWTNNFNRIHIDPMTGRAKLEQPEINPNF